MDENKKPEEQVSAAPAELSKAELDKVAGGGTNAAAGTGNVVDPDISITKQDSSSPKLW